MKKLTTLIFTFLIVLVFSVPSHSAGSACNYLENPLLDVVLKTSTYTSETNLYVAIFTATPSDSGGGTEVTGGSYARVNHNSWNAASGGTATNNGAITFPTPSADWGSVGQFAIFNASTAGDCLVWGDLDVSKTINNGDPAPYFADGDLNVLLD